MTDETPVCPPAGHEDAPRRLDVRPLLARGEDPYATVMSLAAALAPGGQFSIDAPFNPTPLRRALAREGVSSRAERQADGAWHVRFVRDGAEGWEERAEAQVLPEGAMQWEEEDGVHVDVRRLPPPEPLRVIVRLVDSLGPGGRVVVHHDRDPVFLAPELAERGWRIARVATAPAEIRLWLETEGR